MEYRRPGANVEDGSGNSWLSDRPSSKNWTCHSWLASSIARTLFMKKAASCCPLQAFPCHVCIHQLKMYRKHNDHLLWIVTVAGMKAVMGWFADDRESKSCKPHAIPYINLACSWQAQGEVSQLKPQVQDRLSLKERIRLFLFRGHAYADPPWPCFKWTSSLHIQDMRTCQLCAMLLTCIKSIGFGCELKDVQGFLIFLKGHSESIDFIMFCAQWVRFSETTMRKYVCNFGNRRHFEAVWLATCRCLGYLEVTYIHKILLTKNESYMYLVIVPWADGLTNIDQSTKRVRGLVWENDTGICGRNVDTGQNTIIGHSHIMGPIIINYPKHLRSGVLDQEYCLPELSKWHHLLTLAARKGSLDACRLLDCVLHWALWLPHIPCAMGCFERLHLKPPHSFRACPRVCGKETHKQIASSNSELWLTRLIEQLPKSNIESDIYKNHETSCNMMLTITCDDDPFWLHIVFHPGVTQWRITAASQIRACDLQRLSGFCWLFVHRCVVHTWVFFTCPHHRIPCDKVIGLLFSFNIKDLSKTSEILEVALVSCQSRIPAPRVFLQAKCLCLPQNHHIVAVIAPRMH